MSNLFELNKYENQVDTLITVCFILSAMSTLATAIAWIGLAACTVLLGLLVYYPFWCKRNDESLFVPGGFSICFTGAYLLIGLVMI